jgi:hypothetical protein
VAHGEQRQGQGGEQGDDREQNGDRATVPTAGAGTVISMAMRTMLVTRSDMAP